MRLRRTCLIASGLLVFAFSATASSALIGRLPSTPNGLDYQVIYDSDLDVTWLADANYSAKADFGLNPGGNDRYLDNGSMHWETAVGFWGNASANTWVGRLNGDEHLGVSSWRLPQTTQPDPSCSDGAPEGDFGYDCTGGELGHLFYVGLGGVAGTSISENHNSNYALFHDIQDGPYWSGTEVSHQNAWYFDFNNGVQRWTAKENYRFIWVVTDGDPFAPVPIPSAIYLFSAGLLGLASMARDRNMV